MNRIGDSGIITDKYSLFKGKMCVVVGELDNMYLVKLLDKGQERQVLVSKRGIDFVKEEFAKGGRTRFRDKVESISNRLEGTKVPSKYRKDYGTTYDKEESKIAARRIAGAMMKKYGSGGALTRYIVVFQFNDDGELVTAKSKPIPARDEDDAAMILKDQFESLEGKECYILTVKKI